MINTNPNKKPGGGNPMCSQRVISSVIRNEKASLVCLVTIRVRGLWLRCLLYCGGQFYWWKKPEYMQKTTDLPLSLTHFINVVSSTPRHERDSKSQL